VKFSVDILKSGTRWRDSAGSIFICIADELNQVRFTSVLIEALKTIDIWPRVEMEAIVAEKFWG